jgi:hypothetical protein
MERRRRSSSDGIHGEGRFRAAKRLIQFAGMFVPAEGSKNQVKVAADVDKVSGRYSLELTTAPGRSRVYTGFDMLLDPSGQLTGDVGGNSKEYLREMTVNAAQGGVRNTLFVHGSRSEATFKSIFGLEHGDAVQEENDSVKGEGKKKGDKKGHPRYDDKSTGMIQVRTCVCVCVCV